jgi:hypothetical protein
MTENLAPLFETTAEPSGERRGTYPTIEEAVGAAKFDNLRAWSVRDLRMGGNVKFSSWNVEMAKAYEDGQEAGFNGYDDEHESQNIYTGMSRDRWHLGWKRADKLVDPDYN